MGPKATRKNFGLPTAIILVCLTGLVILAQGCGTVRVRHPVPQVLQDEARVVGMPDVRGYGDAPDESLHKSAVESIRQELAAQPGKPAGVFLTPTVDILAISGGGADGALRGRTALRLDRARRSAPVQAGDRHQHRVPHRPFCLPGAGVRCQVERSVHHHQH